jgi:hypothetical protein
MNTIIIIMCINNNITAKIYNKFRIATRQFLSSRLPWTRERNNLTFIENLCTHPQKRSPDCRISKPKTTRSILKLEELNSSFSLYKPRLQLKFPTS